MLRTVLTSVLALVLLAAGSTGLSGATASPVVDASPSHVVSVSGTGVGMYPEFAADTERYAVTTTEDTGGTVDVTATTTDDRGRVWVDGHLAAGPSTTLTGLKPGDEISVIIEDSAGTATHSLLYLPAGFPTLRAVTRKPGAAPGLVGLTLTQWNQPTPSFETVVDQNGVPVYVRAAAKASLDLKAAGRDGHFTVARPTTTAGRTGSAIVELDPGFREIARHETVGLVDTDGHDSVLLGNGHEILIAYEPNAETGLTDAVIQDVYDGRVFFEWRSDGLVDESVVDPSTAAGKDYAHINSVVVMRDGDLLVSFRHLSSVLKIARTAHDGFQEGDIVWRLGGRNSDFTFVDDPYPGGPCAQHTASELPNGHILIYDNGSGGISKNMCIDPADPSGPTVARTFTRVTEYDLGQVDTDPSTPETARLVWAYQPQGRYSFFAGSAQRLPNGNTMVGWATVRDAIATEVAPSGEVVWELKDDVDAGLPPYSTYRALKFRVWDSYVPQIRVLSPRPDVVYRVGERLVLDLECTDRGGSSLRDCGETAHSGDVLDTSVAGKHKLLVRAWDGAGRFTKRVKYYKVGPAIYRPDASAGISGRRWVGDDVYGGAAKQTLVRNIRRDGQSVTSVIRLQNDGNAYERLSVRGTAGSPAFRVAYFVGGRNVTKRMTDYWITTRLLLPGKALRIQVRVTRTKAADPGDRTMFRVRARSQFKMVEDTVAVRASATR